MLENFFIFVSKSDIILTDKKCLYRYSSLYSLYQIWLIFYNIVSNYRIKSNVKRYDLFYNRLFPENVYKNHPQCKQFGILTIHYIDFWNKVFYENTPQAIGLKLLTFVLLLFTGMIK